MAITSSYDVLFEPIQIGPVTAPNRFYQVLHASGMTEANPRFRAEGAHEPVIDFVKKVTARPVVGVGRFTSPDTMVSQLRRGILDLIGAARAGIAGPAGLEAALVAEYLAKSGLTVSYATSAGHASAWTIMTNELPFVHQALHDRGVDIWTQMLLKGFDGQTAQLENIFTGAPLSLEVSSVVIVGHRQPVDSVYHELMAKKDAFADAGIKSVQRIGDALAPGAIVHAVYSGHQYAQQLDGGGSERYLRDIPIAANGPGDVYPGW